MSNNILIKQNKILLVNLPFWTPLIPAQGIAALKSFLQKYDYQVKTVDAAADNRFRKFYGDYFSLLKRYVPEKNWGNFYNIGHDVFRNHMEAYTDYKNREQYMELVKLLVYHSYYHELDKSSVEELDAVIERFFHDLKEYFLNLLREENPFVLGLSVNSGSLASSAYVFKLAKEHCPGIKTVMGGSVFFNQLALDTPDLERFLERTSAYIDKLFIGKGEVLFLKYLKGELPASQRIYTLDDITEAASNPVAAGIPDMSDYDLSRYFYLAAAASYSCPNKCSFCNVRFFFGEHKRRDVKQVVGEMKLLHEKHGHRLFFMADSLLNSVIDDLSQELVREDCPLYLDGYFRVDEPSCSIEKTMAWRKAGLYRVRIGAESGSQRVLDMMGKSISIDLIKKSISSFARAGIKTTAYWVVGHPGETEEDFQLTLDLVEELKNDIWECECNPFTYYYNGQSNADRWAGKRLPVYPAHLENMLMTRTWTLDCEPSREEIYERLYRFVRHCNKLGIPNPYSVGDLIKADERWTKLQKNAVPSILELTGRMAGVVDHVRKKKITNK